MTEEYESEVYDGDITIFDTYCPAGERARKMVFVTPLVIVDDDGSVIDRGVNHRYEAVKMFNFLQERVSSKFYDTLYELMKESERNSYGSMDELNTYRDSRSSIHQIERTIHVLESVREMYEDVRTMVDKEVALLRNKVDDASGDDGDES